MNSGTFEEEKSKPEKKKEKKIKHNHTQQQPLHRRNDPYHIPELSQQTKTHTKMPSTYTPTGQDWDSVNVGRSTVSRPKPKTNAAISSLKRAGLLTTEKRYATGANKSAHSSTTMSARKLEETDELKHNKVDKSLSKAIQQARMAKKMSQKELATAINEKPQVVAEYENGKAIPNGQIIVKIERKLGCKLPRPGKKAKKPAGSAGAAGGVKKSGTTRGGPPKRR